MRKLLIAVFIIIGVSSVYAQGELDQQQKVFFRNERSFGISLNTDGIGFGYRGAKRIDFRNKRLLEIEGGSLKHQKEYKISNPYTTAVISFLENLTLPFISGLESAISMNFTKKPIWGVLPSGIFILQALSLLFINQYITGYYTRYQSTNILLRRKNSALQ